MTITIGASLPQSTFRISGADGPVAKTTDEIFKGRRMVLFAVPGAFTPTCHKNHLPGFLAKAAEIKGKGIDAIACTSTNDVFVLGAWAKATGSEGVIEFLSDGNADFAKAIGLDLDGTGFGLGIRSKRYAMIVDDGKITYLAVEDAPGKADLSSADALLASL
jgi:glutaredoxin/glutathione-dependent peroxiredoxin